MQKNRSQQARRSILYWLLFSACGKCPLTTKPKDTYYGYSYTIQRTPTDVNLPNQPGWCDEARKLGHHCQQLNTTHRPKNLPIHETVRQNCRLLFLLMIYHQALNSIKWYSNRCSTIGTSNFRSASFNWPLTICITYQFVHACCHASSW